MKKIQVTICFVHKGFMEVSYVFLYVLCIHSLMCK